MTDKLNILKDLKYHLQRHYNNTIKDIILFGSQASNTAKSDSDFDILIVLEKDYNRNDENIILDLCYDINLKYNIVINVHFISKTEINSLRGRQPLYTNALSNGIYA
ncbi:MAG: hypothetical protein A2V93_04495 [Ignavibacteria bacterium RBG_16_34_14]|nr:MAG: hypothetical protein A2V93_04495 [Ignavibacteria bacterium RBG_16_34_14]